MAEERDHPTARILAIRMKTIGRSVLQLGGIALVLLGMYNLFGPAIIGLEPWAPYRIPKMVATENGVIFAGDVIVIGAGAAIAWLS